jgi:hypothetical protein
MEHLAGIDPLIALGVVTATALTDAVYVMYTSSVVRRRDLAAANWGSLTYMLSAFAVISFTNNWAYVVFAALGSWIGAYATMKYLRRRLPCAAEHEPAPAPRADAIATSLSHLAPARNCQPLAPSTLHADDRIAA